MLYTRLENYTRRVWLWNANMQESCKAWLISFLKRKPRWERRSLLETNQARVGIVRSFDKGGVTCRSSLRIKWLFNLQLVTIQHSKYCLWPNHRICCWFSSRPYQAGRWAVLTSCRSPKGVRTTEQRNEKECETSLATNLVLKKKKKNPYRCHGSRNCSSSKNCLQTVIAFTPTVSRLAIAHSFFLMLHPQKSNYVFLLEE